MCSGLSGYSVRAMYPNIHSSAVTRSVPGVFASQCVIIDAILEHECLLGPAVVLRFTVPAVLVDYPRKIKARFIYSAASLYPMIILYLTILKVCIYSISWQGSQPPLLGGLVIQEGPSNWLKYLCPSGRKSLEA